MTSAAATAATADSPALFCPACGYDLRGIESDRCPECGLVIDRTALGQSTLPWSHRHRIGRWRSYWRTIFLVLFHPVRFAREVQRPVSLADAKAFRRVTVAIAYVPIALAVVATYMATFEPPLGWPPLIRELDTMLPVSIEPLLISRPAGAWLTLGHAMELMILASLLIAVWLWLLAAAGVASYWFHPPWLDVTRQNRAIALSYYACSPLVATPVTVALVVAAVLLKLRPGTPASASELMNLIAAVAAWAQVTAWWGISMTMLRLVTRCGVTRMAAFIVALPIMWAVLAALIIGGIVGTAVLVAVVVVTMV